MAINALVPRQIKQPAEDRLYDFDFTNLLGAATVAASPAPTVAQEKQNLIVGSVNVTLGAPVISSPKVQVRISGGTAGEDYKITVVARDSAGNTLEADGHLQVREL